MLLFHGLSPLRCRCKKLYSDFSKRTSDGFCTSCFNGSTTVVHCHRQWIVRLLLVSFSACLYLQIDKSLRSCNPFFPDRIVSDSNSVIQRLDWKKWSAPQLLCNSSFHILCLKATLECMSFIFGTISYYHETDVKRLDRSDVSVDIPFRSGQRPMGSGQYC